MIVMKLMTQSRRPILYKNWRATIPMTSGEPSLKLVLFKWMIIMKSMTQSRSTIPITTVSSGKPSLILEFNEWSIFMFLKSSWKRNVQMRNLKSSSTPPWFPFSCIFCISYDNSVCKCRMTMSFLRVQSPDLRHHFDYTEHGHGLYRNF